MSNTIFNYKTFTGVQLILLLVFLCGCASTQTGENLQVAIPSPDISSTPAYPETTVIVENSGEICFKNCGNKCYSLEATFAPSGCFSSGCTRVYEQFGQAKVNEQDFKIQFTTRYVVFDPYGPDPEDERQHHTCTADCMNVNVMEFWLGFAPKGTYEIWLGDDYLGDLNVPPNLPNLDPICFANADTNYHYYD